MLTVYVPLFKGRELLFRRLPAREVAPGICELGPAELEAGARWVFAPGDRVYVERHGSPDAEPKLVAVAPYPDAT